MSARPLIWVLQGSRAGDNAQARELAGRIGGEVVVKHLTFNVLHHAPNWALSRGLASLTAAARQTIAPPWPDLVVATGKRTVPVVRWIKAASGGRSTLVHLGRPRAPLDDFDLVVSTPQYGLPQHRRLMEMALPFAVAKPVAVAELATWRAAWQELPRPLAAVVVGSGKFPLSMSAAALGRLGRLANAVAAEAKGSLLVIMSPRSEAGAHEPILAELTVPHRCYPWSAKGGSPYQAALTLCDQFIVTSDSASMISETLSTGRPVNLFMLPVSPLHFTWSAQKGIAAWLASSGVLQPPRDITRISRQLVEARHVNALGTAPVATRPCQRDDEGVVMRIQSLLAGPQNSLAKRSAS